MKIKILLYSVLVFLLALPVMAAPPKGELSHTNYSATVDNTISIDANLIFMFVTNHGNFGRDLGGVFGHDYGSWYPFTSVYDIENNINNAASKTPNYASGIWVGGVVGNDTLVAISEYSSEYVPGPMAGGTFQADAPEFRVYKLFSDSLKNNPNQDYTDYMNYAVDQGAPTMIDDDGDLVPDMIGDQMLWSIYNDADPDQHDNMETDPLGLEIKQTVFAWSQEGSLGSMIFIKYQVFNKGGNTINDFYLSLWCDPDLGTSSDDLVGCDTTAGLGFVYNEDEYDSKYNGTAPAMGFDFFQGPLRAKTEDDPSEMIGRMWNTSYTDSVNIGMVSFNKYINGTDPDDFRETYKYMLGLDAKANEPYVYNGDTIKYQHSGDPINGTGDLDLAGADKRWMQTTGPITFAPGDSTEILAAVVIGQGSTVDQSIQVMKELDIFAQKLYEDGFNPPAPPARPKVTVAHIDDNIAFSWTDTSEVDPGEYEFEGYSVWQGAGSSGPWTLLSTYDVINDKTDALIDTAFNLEAGLKLPVVKRPVKNTGLNYHYIATEDKLLGEPFRNYSTYYFRVSAFSFAYIGEDEETGDPIYYKEDGTIIPTGDRFLESSTILTITPQAPLAGVESSVFSFDTLEVTHTSTGAVLSGGSVIPMVLDPLALTGDTYEVVFVDEVVLTDTVVWNGKTYLPDTYDGPLWHIFNTTTDDTMIFMGSNQSGDDEYLAFDGVVVKVVGPPPVMDDFEYTGSARQIGGVDWGGSGFFGGIGVLDEFFVSDLTPADVRIVEFRWVEDGMGQNAYLYDRSNGYVFEGYFPQNFTLWDVTPGSPERQINFSFVENDYDPPHTQRDSIWNPGEQLNDVSLPYPDGSWDTYGGREYFQIMSSDYSETPNPLYAIDGWFNGSASDPALWDVLWGGWLNNRGGTRPTGKPEVGDTFKLIPFFVNTPADKFTFSTEAVTLTMSASELDNIKAVPNPYYINGGYDPSVGNYQVKFTHLPEKCTIRIFNLSGTQVATVEKDDPTTNTASWDLLTSNNLPVASGIYIYVVEAPGYGEKVGKMAVFVEQEVLRIY